MNTLNCLTQSTSADMIPLPPQACAIPLPPAPQDPADFADVVLARSYQKSVDVAAGELHLVVLLILADDHSTSHIRWTNS